MKALLAKKVGMTQIFDANGVRSGVTVLEVGPCVVTALKSVETDGYSAVQIGYGEAKKLSKTQAGQLKKSGAKSTVLREVRNDEIIEVIEGEDQPTQLKIGDKLTAEMFEVGEKIVVSAISKGKGFAGTIKRHNFNTGPKTHGSHNYRAPGSIGAGYPQHVFKGMKMAGQMGHEKVTIKNQKIAMVDVENNLIAVVGSVPGPRRGIVMIKGAK
ncbi:MAG: 50S ribosomal protein L3 [Patescibacteria group bacterium]|jgi:large subunit ribosomal protein L3|nr:50S ribosomal protein L3 [Patescibacteria group bacterium]